MDEGTRLMSNLQSGPGALHGARHSVSSHEGGERHRVGACETGQHRGPWDPPPLLLHRRAAPRASHAHAHAHHPQHPPEPRSGRSVSWLLP